MSRDFSLLKFIETPILVVDPLGKVVLANPAFRRRFEAGLEGGGEPRLGDLRVEPESPSSPPSCRPANPG
jgi:hypothetical protein